VQNLRERLFLPEQNIRDPVRSGDGLPRSATAHILDDSVVLSLEKSKLRGLIINYPELSLGMLKSLSLHLRKANLRSRDI
jgi:CRP/FNR family transcriptional regulator, cyclic AMP receptor protein